MIRRALSTSKTPFSPATWKPAWPPQVFLALFSATVRAPLIRLVTTCCDLLTAVTARWLVGGLRWPILGSALCRITAARRRPTRYSPTARPLTPAIPSVARAHLVGFSELTSGAGYVTLMATTTARRGATSARWSLAGARMCRCRRTTMGTARRT